MVAATIPANCFFVGRISIHLGRYQIYPGRDFTHRNNGLLCAPNTWPSWRRSSRNTTRLSPARASTRRRRVTSLIAPGSSVRHGPARSSAQNSVFFRYLDQVPVGEPHGLSLTDSDNRPGARASSLRRFNQQSDGTAAGVGQDSVGNRGRRRESESRPRVIGGPAPRSVRERTDRGRSE